MPGDQSDTDLMNVSKLRQELKARRLLMQGGKQWNKLQWSRDQEKLVAVENEALDIHRADQVLEGIQAQVQKPGLVLRFHVHPSSPEAGDQAQGSGG